MTSSKRSLIVQMLPTVEVGGAERIAVELAERLPKEGFDVHMIALMGGGRLAANLTARGIPVTIFEKRGPWGSFGFFPTLSALRRLRPAIVHTHLFGADLWGRLAAVCARVPHILSTEHNLFPSESLPVRWIKRALAFPTEVLVAVSKVVRDQMVSRDHLPRKKIRVIHNGIDVSRIRQRTGGSFHDIPRLMTVGRLEPQKGHATLLKALALVKRPWRLDLVGAGSLERELRALAERLRIAPRVRWLGFRADVPELLAASDLFCFPSFWEGFGLAAVEAAAAGVPIIASDLHVFRELLGDAATYTPVGDAPALARAIEQLLRDPLPALAQAQQAVARIRSTYSIEVMVQKYARLYHHLLKGCV